MFCSLMKFYQAIFIEQKRFLATQYLSVVKDIQAQNKELNKKWIGKIYIILLCFNQSTCFLLQLHPQAFVFT